MYNTYEIVDLLLAKRYLAMFTIEKLKTERYTFWLEALLLGAPPFKTLLLRK